MSAQNPSKTTALADPISADLKGLMRALKLGKLLDTLPERLAIARQQQLPYAEFLELIFSDEVTRRDTNSANLRARAIPPDRLTSRQENRLTENAVCQSTGEGGTYVEGGGRVSPM